MKAAVIDNFGLDAELCIRDMPIPKIEADQILVEIYSTCVNPIDWKIKQGQMGARYGGNFKTTLCSFFTFSSIKEPHKIDRNNLSNPTDVSTT